MARDDCDDDVLDQPLSAWVERASGGLTTADNDSACRRLMRCRLLFAWSTTACVCRL